ncbi:MAG: hydroxyacid dehydrogenase [Oscillospiraceae bacterium]|nr:hydroxyacid dehydrogenase [Oscillospiraceae bacterium]
MKSIYLNENPENVRRVYCVEDTVYQKADVLANPERFASVEVLFSTWGMPCFTEEEIITCFPSLKALFYAAGSVQVFARPFLNRGIRVFSAWAANAVPVAEYTVAQIVLANKGFFKTVRTQVRREAETLIQQFPGNYNGKIGIIGAGMVGKLVIQLLRNYQLQVLVFDPFLTDEEAERLGVTKCSLKTLFEECCVVSNHLANNAETKGMLTHEHFSSMRPYATFINTGRGAQVVEADLIDVLKQRPDLTAILDVTDPEPPVSGSELYLLENCMLTPHIAGSIGNEVQRMGEYMMTEYRGFLENKVCNYEVTLEMLKTMA